MASDPSDDDDDDDGAPPPFPWLMYRQLVEEEHVGLRCFGLIPEHRFRGHAVPSATTYRCVASGHGWLVLAAVSAPRSILLLNPVTQARVDVEWPYGNRYIDRLHAVLTSSPRDPECLLAVASDRIIAYCRPCRGKRGARWQTRLAAGFRYDAAASDMVSDGAMVYLVDERRDLRRINLADPDPKVERRCTRFPLPRGARLRRYYLVESLGVVHLVLTNERCYRVFLFRMDWGGSRWVEAKDGASDRVLLLGRGCSAIVPASVARRPEQSTLLAACQPSTFAIDAECVGGQVWHWMELVEGPDGPVTLIWPSEIPPCEFNAVDTLWFFPAKDPDDTCA